MRNALASARHVGRMLGVIAGAVALLATAPARAAEQAIQSVSVVYPAEISDIRPSRGAAGGGTVITARGYKLAASPTVTVGGTAASVQGSPNCVTMGALNNCNRVTFVAPAKPAGTMHDVVISGVTLPQGYFVNFTDVPDASPFAPFVEKMVRWGVTAGVGGGAYGVSGDVTRAQMAIFLMKAKFGINYVPPPMTGTIFADVPPGAFGGAFIEQMYLQGMTGGCVASPLQFCPNSSVTREQMAVFLMRAMKGPGFIPPAATGMFSDMGGAHAGFAPWAEEMKREGVTAGTSPTTFGPTIPVSRGAMAIFLERSFNEDYLRLAQQATWGGNQVTVARIRELGIAGWLNEQFFAGSSAWPMLPTAPDDTPNGCSGACQRDHYTMYKLQNQFFLKGMYGADQLRQRTVWALHQLFVVAGRDPINLPFWLDGYLRTIDAQPFGSFRTLMEDMTMNPTMGRWLDMATSTKNNPNENFAREILQLFSVGTQKLYIDGTGEVDGLGLPVDTYDQDVVDGFTFVFTGWRLAPSLGLEPGSPGCVSNCTVSNYRDPMVLVQNNHYTNGGQTLLDGFTMPTGLTAAQEMDVALDNIFNHPNVGPFVAKHLISNLVTRNPTPGYVWRVAEVFNNDGGFVRGNLYKVVEAVLTDPEARGDFKLDPNYGHKKEPALVLMNTLRGLNAHGYNNPAASTDGVYEAIGGNPAVVAFTPRPSALEQDILRPVTVFNYYPLDYLTPGTTDHWGAEFGIWNANTSLKMSNWFNTMLLGCVNTTSTTPSCTTIGIPRQTTGQIDRPFGTTLNITPWVNLATSSAGNTMWVVDEMNRYFMHGMMSPQMKTALVTAADAVVPNTNHDKRVRTLLYLLMTSPQYQVER